MEILLRGDTSIGVYDGSSTYKEERVFPIIILHILNTYLLMCLPFNISIFPYFVISVKKKANIIRVGRLHVRMTLTHSSALTVETQSLQL